MIRAVRFALIWASMPFCVQHECVASPAGGLLLINNSTICPVTENMLLIWSILVKYWCTEPTGEVHWLNISTCTSY